RGTRRHHSRRARSSLSQSSSRWTQWHAQIQQPGSRHDDGDALRRKYHCQHQTLRSVAGESGRRISRSRRRACGRNSGNGNSSRANASPGYARARARRLIAGAAVPPSFIFQDRTDAGRQLAEELLSYAGRDDVIVLALPRGGVPVAFEVAQRLGVPLDVFVVRKLGVPGHEELAMGAIASGGIRVLNEDVLYVLPDAQSIVEMVTAIEREELKRRERDYRGDRPAPEVRGQTVILVDDGLATGATMRAAAAALRQQGAAKIIVAVPVGAPSSCHEIRSVADEVVCLQTPGSFMGVGQYYEDFSQTTDEEVRELLAR